MDWTILCELFQNVQVLAENIQLSAGKKEVDVNFCISKSKFQSDQCANHKRYM